MKNLLKLRRMKDAAKALNQLRVAALADETGEQFTQVLLGLPA
jgi:hypothetical protein